jgi:hypothetical protein
VTVSYLPVSVWTFPSGNFAHLHAAGAVSSGERSRWWEVREFDAHSRLVQRRTYETEALAIDWIEEFGGVLA